MGVCAVGAIFATSGWAIRAAVELDGRVGILERSDQVEQREHEQLGAWLERVEGKLDRLTERLTAR